MKVSIYGCGYVGLISGVCLAKLGHEVICYDISREKIHQLSQGIETIYENGLSPLLQEALQTKRISFTNQLEQAVAFSSLHFITVGTPPGADGSADLSQIYEVSRQMAQFLQGKVTIVIKSTVPVGTTQKVRQIIQEVLLETQKSVLCTVLFHPEFLQEGNAIETFMNPDRIIVGTDSPEALAELTDLYSPLRSQNNKNIPLLQLSIRSAEMTKYASNAFLAAKISFINQISCIAERIGADIHEIKEGMSYDKRIGSFMLDAGCGFGGSCFSKDIHALIKVAENHDYKPQMLHAVLEINEDQKHILFDKVSTFLDGSLEGKQIALWGLAFKPHTDDIRDAPSCVLLEAFLQAGAFVKAYDPVAEKNILEKYHTATRLTLCPTKEEALEGSDVLVIVTDWPEFQTANLADLKRHLKLQAVFDGRNIFNPAAILAQNIQYYGIGCGLSI